MADDEQVRPPELDLTSEIGALASSLTNDDKSKDEPFGFLDAAAKRVFSEGEVAQSITIRFLVESLKERKEEISNLKPFQAKWYETDRDLQVERGKAKLTKAQEVVSLCLTTIGGIGLGISLKFFEKEPIIAGCAFILFASLVATGIYFKVSTK